MAQGMIGAKTDELRALGGIYTTHAKAVEQAFTETVQLVQDVHWVGADATSYKVDYVTTLGPLILRLAEHLSHTQTELAKQAEEQDICSSVKGGDSLYTKLDKWITNFFGEGYRRFKLVLSGLNVPRLAVELGVLARYRDLFLRNMNRNPFDWRYTLRMERLAATGITGYLYNAVRTVTDTLQLNWKNGPFNIANLPFVQTLINRNPRVQQFFDTWLKEGWSQKFEKWAAHAIPALPNVKDLVGKAGRVVGRFLGVADTLLNADSMMNAYRAGDNRMGTYYLAKTIASGLSVMKGPVGLVGSALGAGFYLFENRGSIGDYARGALDFITGGGNRSVAPTRGGKPW